MTSHDLNTLFLPTVFVALTAAIVFVRRWHRRRRLSRASQQSIEPCKCGYPLESLSVPRCPECGRVIGFNATPEELTLNIEQLERINAARERRKRDGIP